MANVNLVDSNDIVVLQNNSNISLNLSSILSNKIIYDWGFDSIGYHYYIRFSNGTMVKYGYYTIGAISANSGFTQTINTSIPFVNAEYVVFTTKRMGGASNFANLVDSVGIVSESQFTIITWCNAGSFSGGNNSYLCIGNWK